jgi:hypothetical protein
MQSNTQDSDLKTLIGNITADYLRQEQEQELLAADAEDFEGYTEWSADLERDPWQDARNVKGILIKKACEHTDCAHFQCSKSTRLGGIEI